ncbi:hypothetical protein OUZ56_008406 [Daphnia magna]|uniref:Uncharacterized protein n=1 Tax=Daphnia magna TaxID=35525 RepID=A0ABR0ACY4_9CRUS|nr:hypothetical protein OUZ56_008406 [Daphnia magna]
MVVEAENLSLSPQVFRFGRKFARVSKIINKKVKANDYFVQMATFKPTPIVSPFLRRPFVLFFEDNPRALFSTFPTAAAIFNPLQHLV